MTAADRDHAIRLNRDALRAAHVNPDTRLATDYLNHFNEVAMLLEMLPDMPDLADDVLAWTPRAYDAHFETTGHSHRAVVIAAWRAAPRDIRDRLDALVAAIDHTIAGLQTQVRAGDFAGAADAARCELAPLLATARGLVNGDGEGQTVPDAVF